MDSLKLIPQIFFDLIARVIPGAIGIVAYLRLTDSTWASFLTTVFGLSSAGSSLTIVALSFLCASYIVGQLLSPAAKLVQRIGEFEWLEYKLLSPVVKIAQRIVNLERLKPKPKKDDAYDWLRLHHPEAGAHCAKIRAEFTMHNGLAVVLLVSAVIYRLTHNEWRWSVLGGLALATVLAAYRGRATRDTFQETVSKFAKAAGYSNGNPTTH